MIHFKTREKNEQKHLEKLKLNLFSPYNGRTNIKISINLFSYSFLYSSFKKLCYGRNTYFLWGKNNLLNMFK